MNLQDYIFVVDDSIDAGMCDFAVDAFEHNASIREAYDDPKGMKFSQLNVTSAAKTNSQLETLQNYMNEASRFYIELYKSRIADTDFWPNTYGFEEYRLKKYEANGKDQFAEHIDAANLDSARRFLVFFWYLNDVNVGGETEFMNMDLRVLPKKGRLIMFPPLWTFPHRGNRPITGPKYILGSYLHFV